MGFEIIKENFGKWPKIPIKMKFFHKDFKIYNEDDLINRTSSIIVKLK